ncbi:MAG: OmpA family protein [Bacteroidetes bacterium]|nr:OmpA family protein [Bacteroidota bacterium]
MNKPRTLGFFSAQYTLLLVFLLIASTGSSQFWKGLRMYERDQYQEAVVAFEEAINRWPNDTMSWRMMGKTQMLMVDFESAERTYEELNYRTTLNDEDQMNWAKCLMHQGKYGQAADLLEKLVTSKEVPEYAKRIWDQCMLKLKVSEDERYWEIAALQFPGLETASAPGISNGMLYFSTEPFRWGQSDDKTRLGRNEVWTLDLKSNNPHVMRAKTVKELNLPEHDGIICLSPDGKSIAYSKKSESTLAWFGDPMNGGYQLLISTRVNDSIWAESRPFPFVEKGFVFAHPTFSPDGSRLYFSTDLPSPESQGGLDLWVSQRNGTFWEEPVNLGPEVNTEGDEVFPTFDKNGRLYFSSDGHPSLGGLDVYWTEVDTTVQQEARHWRQGDAWTKPVRLRFPINTMADDFSFVPEEDLNQAFICSNRAGKDEVFRVEQTSDKVVCEIFVNDYSTGMPISRVPIRIIDMQDGSAWDTRTELDGTLKLELPENRGYRVEVALKGYLTHRTVITTETMNSVLNVELAKIQTLNHQQFAAEYMGGRPFELAGLNWEAQDRITRSSESVLYELADFLKLNPEIFLEIRSHEDASSWDFDDQPNQRISKNRSIEIESFLLKAGVSPKQMISVGKGIDELRNDCLPGEPCASYNHELNNRTEFRIYGLLQQTPGQINPVQFQKGS